MIPINIEHFINNLIQQGSLLTGYKINANKNGVAVTLQYSNTDPRLEKTVKKSPSRDKRDHARMTKHNDEKAELENDHDHIRDDTHMHTACLHNINSCSTPITPIVNVCDSGYSSKLMPENIQIIRTSDINGEKK